MLWLATMLETSLSINAEALSSLIDPVGEAAHGSRPPP
jgi:hypothetical protein